MTLSSSASSIYLLGYFGYRNLGDDLMLEALLERFEASPSIAKATVDMHEDTLSRWPAKSRPVTGVGFAAKLRRLLAFMRADCVMWGGGTCLYDAGDNSGMVRLLRYARLARALGKPFYLVNIGIGRLETEQARTLAADILRETTVATFRDEQSFELARRLAPSLDRYSLGGDLATLRTLPLVANKAARVRTLAFSGVREAADDPELVAASARSLEALAAQGVKITFIPFHGGEYSDHVFHRAVARNLPPDSYTLAEVNCAEDAVRLLSEADFHVGMRLHSVVVADLMGLPGLGLSYHPKVAYYAKRQNGEHRLAAPEAGFSMDHVNAVLASYERPSASLAQEQQAALRGLCVGIL